MKKIILTIPIIVMVTLTYGQSKNQAMKTDQEQVLYVTQQLFKGTAEKTEALIRDNTADGFLFTTANADVQDEETYIKGFAMNPAVTIPLLTTSEEQVIIRHETAILTAVVHINIIMNGTHRDLWERVTGTFIKEGGQWKMLALHATYIPKK